MPQVVVRQLDAGDAENAAIFEHEGHRIGGLGLKTVRQRRHRHAPVAVLAAGHTLSRAGVARGGLERHCEEIVFGRTGAGIESKLRSPIELRFQAAVFDDGRRSACKEQIVALQVCIGNRVDVDDVHRLLFAIGPILRVARQVFCVQHNVYARRLADSKGFHHGADKVVQQLLGKLFVVDKGGSVNRLAVGQILGTGVHLLGKAVDVASDVAHALFEGP